MTLACSGIYIILIVYYYCLVDPGLSGLVRSCAAERLLNVMWPVAADLVLPQKQSGWGVTPRHNPDGGFRAVITPTARSSQRAELSARTLGLSICMDLSGRPHKGVQNQSPICVNTVVKMKKCEGRNEMEQAWTEFLLRAAQLADGMNLNTLLKRQTVSFFLLVEEADFYQSVIHHTAIILLWPENIGEKFWHLKKMFSLIGSE